MEKPFAPGHTTCPMCGALCCGDLPEKAHVRDAEIIHRLALFMQDDWRACCTFLLSIATQRRSVEIKTRHNLLSPEFIFQSRQIAAARFPDLAETLGIK